MKKLIKRKKNRLQNYDYSTPGYYYITICTKNFVEYFGKISNEQMRLNELGKIADSKCREIPDHYNINIAEYKVLPNHIHLIIIIREIEKDTEKRKISLISTVIKSLKGIITKEIRASYNTAFQWQRSYYDHIIRNDESLYKISTYIKYNELKWLYESRIPRN